MKGSKVFSIFALLAAISGVVLAVGRYMKKKGIHLRDALDFRNNIYAEEEDLPFDEVYDENASGISPELGVDADEEEPSPADTTPDTPEE